MVPQMNQTTETVIGKGKVRFVRVSPRKAQLLADLIRGKTVGEALRILKFANRPSADKIIEQLVLNAVNSVDKRAHKNTDGLVIQAITVDQGPVQKRWRPRAFGRSGRIRKKTSHIRLSLTE